MKTLLEMSIMGGMMIAVIVILRAVTIHKLPKNVFLILWAVTLLRLLLPFSIPSPASVWSVAEQAGVTVRRPGILVSQAAARPAAVNSPSTAAIVWVSVAALCALVFLILHLRGRRNYRISLPVEHPFVQAWMERHRLRRPVQVRYSDQITAPFTYGILWPVILLPKNLDWTDEHRLAFILTHELAHIRRFDALWKWILAASLCLHWFNPLVWVMYVLSNRDLELSCDEMVVRSFGREARAPYALTLVGLEEKRTHFMPLASSFSKNAMEERITAIMKIKKTTMAGIAAALVLVAAVTVVFATSAAPVQSPSLPAPTPVQSPLPAQSPSPSPSARVSPGAAETKGNVYEDKYGIWDGESDAPPSYTKEQYDLVIRSFQFEGWETMSIAEFNRTLNAAYSQSEDTDNDDYTASLSYAYEMVLMSIPADDPNASFLRNTVQASLEEYQSRLTEVYSGKRNDPEFSGTAERWREDDVFGETVRTNYIRADYSFTYRILDQDKLTVTERDQFLQAVMQGAQDYLNGRTIGELIDDANAQASFQTALEAAGKAATNAKIEFTGCEVNYFEDY